MSKTRAPYPPEFRQQMVELVRAGTHRKSWRGSSAPVRPLST